MGAKHATLLVAAAALARASSLVPEYVQPEPFAWEEAAAAAASYYVPSAALAGDPLSCCGSEIVGDPEYDEDPYTCGCDLTLRACDLGCCCDPDCDAAGVDVTALFSCLTDEAATTPISVKHCSDELVHVNLPASALARGWKEATDLDGLTCIVRDNSPSRGDWLDDPSEDSALTAAEVRAEFAAHSETTYSTWLAAQTAPYTAAATSYALGEPVLGDGCLGGGETASCTALSPLLLPARAEDGTCDTSSAAWIPFLSSANPYSCTPAADETLEQLCASLYNAAAAFSTNSKVAATPSTTQLRELVFYYREAADAPFLGPVSFDGLPNAGAAFYSAGNGCGNALVTLHYEFSVNGTMGRVDSAAAYLGFGTLSAAVGPSYGAAFTLGNATEASDQRAVSGRPGYARGYPVLVGDGEASSALELRAGGLNLLGREVDGACVREADAQGSTAALAGALQLRFGEESASSCALTFATAAELQAWCEAGESAGTDLSLRPLLSALALTGAASAGGGLNLWLAAFGDSHTGAAADWVQVRLEGDAPAAMGWHAPTQSCMDVISLVELQVLYAAVGSASQPNDKIIGARLSISTQTLRAARCALGSSSCTTYGSVSAASTFLKLPNTGRLYDYVPPTPELISPFPSDLFYPFLTHADDDGRRRLEDETPRYATAAAETTAAKGRGGLWSYLGF